MITTSLEKVAYHAIRIEPEFIRVTKPKYFENKDIQIVFKIDKAYFNKYNKVPSKTQLWQLIQLNNIQEINENKLDALFEVNLNEIDSKWLKESIEAFIEIKTLNTSIEDVVEYLHTYKIDMNNVKSVVSTVKDIVLKRNNLSFGIDYGLDFFNPEHHIQLKSDTFTTGYPFLDQTLGGGYENKTLVTLIGKPKVGKSIWLTNLACNAIKNGFNTAYISFEMRDKKVLKRFGANMLNISMSEYDDFSQNTSGVKERLSGIGSDMLQATPGNLFVKEYPASSAGVPDVELFLQKLEEAKNIKFKLIVLDYINIMANWRNPHTENLYMKIKQIAEDLRAMATRNEWCVLTASQINREGFKLSDITMSNISESVGLLHTVDALFAIIQDSAQHMANSYTLKALALRNAEGMDKKKDFIVDYNYMRITESPDNTTAADDDSYNSLFRM